MKFVIFWVLCYGGSGLNTGYGHGKRGY